MTVALPALLALLERDAETSEILVTKLAYAVVRVSESFVVVGDDIQVLQGVGDG